MVGTADLKIPSMLSSSSSPHHSTDIYENETIAGIGI